MSGAPLFPSLLAGITVYRPDPVLLRSLVERLRADRVETLVYVDGPLGEAIGADCLGWLGARPGLAVLPSPVNRGIGAGLNALAAEAARRGAARLLIFDQDSGPPPGMASALAGRLDRLSRADGRPAAVGPSLVTPVGVTHQTPRYRPMAAVTPREGATAVRYLITSGTMLDLAAWREVGPFREDYVIDAIDTEWCFRAWARGWTIWRADDIAMEHRVGTGIVRVGPLRFPRQSPARMATYLRNQAHGLTLAHVPFGWKLRTVAYLPVQAAVFSLAQPRSWRTLAALARAIGRGLAGRLGKTP